MGGRADPRPYLWPGRTLAVAGAPHRPTPEAIDACKGEKAKARATSQIVAIDTVKDNCLSSAGATNWHAQRKVARRTIAPVG